MWHILHLFLELMGGHLEEKVLASLALVNRETNTLVTPYLYHTLRFHGPGQISSSDRFLLMLDTIADPLFDKTRYTRRVLVTGSWYQTYDAIDSDLGPEQILSPAARMLSTLVSCCVTRMPNLREFIWDLQVSTTQKLVSAVLIRPRLQKLQLRLGTDGTPNPYFYPVLDLSGLINVRCLNLVQLDNESVLNSIGRALLFADNLRELALWADEDSQLSVGTLFAQWRHLPKFQLISLDLRGFADLGHNAQVLWKHILPSTLKDLTLEIGASFRVEDCEEFWRSSIEADLRPLRLTSNLAASGLREFVSSFSGLEVFNVTPSHSCRPVEPLSSLLDTLRKRHSETLRALGISPQDQKDDYRVDAQFFAEEIATCPQIEELRFGLRGLDLAPILIALRTLPNLRVIHIVGVRAIGYHTSQLRSFISQYLNSGLGNRVKYVAFDDGPVYQIVHSPIIWLKRNNTIGYIGDSALLMDKLFIWVASGN